MINERNQLEHSKEKIITHSHADCGGEQCTIHNRSNHNMRSWPQHFRSDRGIIERFNPFGGACPDPDQFDYWLKNGQLWQAIHGCVVNPVTRDGGVCSPGWTIDDTPAAWLGGLYGYAITDDGRVWSFWEDDNVNWAKPQQLAVEKYNKIRIKDGTTYSVSSLLKKAWGI